MSAPRWIITALTSVVPDDEQDEVIGDLEEVHRRRVHRWSAATSTAVTTAEGTWLLFVHAVRGLGRSIARGGGVSRLELRLAWRLLWKQPLLTLTSVVALGAGIGMAAGGISLFQQILYSDVPFEDGDRWAVIESYEADSGRRVPLDLERANVFRTSSPAISYLGAFESGEFNVVHPGGEVERVAGARVSPATFRHLPYVPLLGRLFSERDGGPGVEPVVLVRESLWRRRLSASPDAVGGTLRIAGGSFTIVGVLPDEARYPSEGEIWLPLDERTLGAEGDRDGVAGTRSLATLADGVTVDEAARQLEPLSDAVAESRRGAPRLRHRITPMAATVSSPQAYLGSLVASMMLASVLLVIALNVSNLIVARTSRRSAELAVRTALGASRARLVGQIFVEVLAIGAIAAAPGLVAADAVLRVYDRVLDELPFWIDLTLRPSTAVLVVALALVASGVMGIIPALRATRRNPGDALRATGRGGLAGIGRFGAAMIAVEVALSVALLGTALVFVQGFRAYVEPAFALPDDRVLTARVRMDVEERDLEEDGAASVGDSIATVAAALTRRVAEIPGVRVAAVSSHPPRLSPWPESVEVEGLAERTVAPVVYQSPGFFEVLEVAPLAGRDFSETDLRAGAPAVAIVNRSFALSHFGSVQATGRRIRLGDGGADPPEQAWREIVGVVPDVMEVTRPEGASGVYLPFSPVRFFTIAARVDADPVSFTGALRSAAFDLDPDLVLSEVVRLDQVGAENRAAFAVMSSALVGIGLVTLLLSLAGVYSIVSLAVSQRTREIGVRVALGARPVSILGHVLRRAMVLVLAGGMLGAAAGTAFTQADLFVFALPKAGPWLFPMLLMGMALAGAAACWIPTRRALAIQPVTALKEET